MGSPDQVYVNGSFGAYKKDLMRIGYYSEFVRTYGWDDSDLYERLASVGGLATRYLEPKSVFHLDQSDDSRISHQNVIPYKFLGTVEPTIFTNQRNKFIARTTSYWNKQRLQDYA